MKLENQVVSLQLAKKLKELGFEQNGFYECHKSADENYRALKLKYDSSVVI
jgi:hypothetical protein